MKRMLAVCALLLFMFAGAISAASAESAPTFTAQSYSAADGTTVQYWLFSPADAAAELPLIVYLHGGSGKGDDLALLTANGFCKWVSEGQFDDVPAYMIFPQLSSSYTGWANNKTNIRNLIASVVKKYEIDANRISLVGHSMGGTGAYSLAAAYPSMFSCVMPMSGSITNNEKNLTALSSMPVWAIVGSEDTIVPPASSVEFIAALQDRGANAQITVLEGATHFTVPELAFLNEELNVVGWLTRQGEAQGKVTVQDALDALHCLLNGGTDTAYDADGDGTLSLRDVLVLLRAAAA